MKKKIKLPYSIRKSRALHQHWTQKGGTLVAKVPFRTLNDALDFMNKKHINKDLYHPYVCRECGMWHIGHTKKK